MSHFCFYLLYRRCYIQFIRKVNDKKGVEGQEETKKAFDFMLSYVGLSYLYAFGMISDVYPVMFCSRLFLILFVGHLNNKIFSCLGNSGQIWETLD